MIRHLVIVVVVVSLTDWCAFFYEPGAHHPLHQYALRNEWTKGAKVGR
jgi:hypothetical protein